MLRKRKPKQVIINLTIASIYFPVDHVEHEQMVKFVEGKVMEWPKNIHIVIGQDSNAKLGVADQLDVEELSDS